MNTGIQLNERQRIAAYQRGWNDAQQGRAARKDQAIMYMIGFVEATRGSTQRFVNHGDH